MASSIETTSTTTTLKNNGNTYLSVDTNDDVAITNTLTATSPTFVTPNIGAATVTSLNGGPLAGFRNRVINGMFDVWQRGTSFSSSSVNEYSADRWRTEGYSQSTSVVRGTFGNTESLGGDFASYYARVTTNAAIPSGQYWAFQQRIETPQVLRGGETVTLSYWARAVSGTIEAGRFTSSLGANPALTTTWQKITGSYTVSASSTSYSLYLMYLGAGKAATAVDFANVQLEVGTVATPFERRPYGTELALCQRYYETGYSRMRVDPFSFGALGTSMSYAATKRVEPTVAGTAVLGTISGTLSATVSHIFINFSAGSSGNVSATWTATAEL